MPFHLPDSDMESSHVQMYFVPGASTGRTHTNSPAEASKPHIHQNSLQSSALERGDSNKLHRTESLESLLSLNVWASDLLSDHDDLQDLSSTLTFSPREERRQAWYGAPDSETGDLAGPSSSSPSHSRNLSYSTVSSGAPETPPSAAQQTFTTTIASPGGAFSDNLYPSHSRGNSLSSLKVEDGADKSFRADSIQSKGPERSLRNYGRRGIAYELSQRAGSSKSLSQQPTNVAEEAHTNELRLPELQLPITRLSLSEDEDRLREARNAEVFPQYNSLENEKTPLAEISDPLDSAPLHEEANIHDMKPDQRSAGMLDESEGEKGDRQEDVVEIPDEQVTGQEADDNSLEVTQTGRGQEENLVDSANQVDTDISTQKIAVETPLPAEVFEQDDRDYAGHADTSSGLHQLPPTKKLSELLKERYESRKPLADQPTEQQNTQTERAPQSDESQRGDHIHATPPSQSNPLASTSGAQVPERDALLHTIINKDFGGSTVITGPSVSHSTDTNQLWHPTEYVGPPRRRSFSSTNLLALKRPVSSSGSMPASGVTYRRQQSSEGLASNTIQRPASRISVSRSFATSTDDLLIPPQDDDRDASSVGEGRLYAHESTGQHSTRPKTAEVISSPLRSMSSSQALTERTSSALPSPKPEAPFDGMITTTDLPPVPRATTTSKPHKRSLSGSLQTFLPGFSSTSKSKKSKADTRVVSPILEIKPATVPEVTAIHPRSTSSLSHHTGSSASSERRDWTEPWTPMIGKPQKVERRISLRAWKYPTSKSSKHAEREPTLPVVSDELLIAPPSPFSLEAPKNSGLRQPGRPHRAEAQRRRSTRHLVDQEGQRIKGLASEQVARDSHVRAKVVEKFKDHERSVSAI